MDLKRGNSGQQGASNSQGPRNIGNAKDHMKGMEGLSEQMDQFTIAQ